MPLYKGLRILTAVGKSLFCKILIANIIAKVISLSNFNGAMAPGKISYKPESNFFLPYMLRLKEDFYAEPINSSNVCKRPFLQECRQRHNSIFYFNELVYDVVCNNITSDFHLCNYTAENSTVLAFPSKSIVDEPIFRFIHAYIRAEKKSLTLFKTNLSGYKLKYKEVIMEDVPFCFSISCPSFADRKNNSTLALSALDSMPFWCQFGFYIAFVFDVALSFIVAFSNGIVIVIGLRNSFVAFPWGCFTMSLAFSDAVVGFVTHPCTIYSFYNQYNEKTAARYLRHSDFYLISTGLIQTVSMCSSLLTLITLTIYRYLALAKPFTYHNHRKRMGFFAKRGLLAVWLFSVVLGLVTAFKLIPGDKFEVHPIGMTLSKKMSDLYLYQTIIIVSATVLWSFFAKTNAALRHVTVSIGKRGKRNDKEIMVLTLRAMIMAFTVCYLPLAIIQTFYDLPILKLKNYPDFSPVGNFLWNVCMWFASRLVVLNSLLNCVIFNARNKHVINRLKEIRFELYLLFGIRRTFFNSDEVKQSTQTFL